MTESFMSETEIQVKTALETAKQLLETLKRAPSEGKAETILWNVAAELEYAAALISVTHELEDFDPLVAERRSPRSALEVAEQALMLLNEASHRLDSDVHSSYINLRRAIRVTRSL